MKKTKYYVCGMRGIISTHRTEDAAQKAYERKYKQIEKMNMIPVIGIFKKEKGTRYQREFVGMRGEECIYEWEKVDSLIVQY
jgi:hypothetical protein